MQAVRIIFHGLDFVGSDSYFISLYLVTKETVGQSRSKVNVTKSRR